MSQSVLLSRLNAAFRPPFRGLGVWIWLFFVWAFMVHPDTPILRGVFADSDDAIHLVRVIEWLKGQAWFDPVLHRLAPPEGVPIHYARLAELPLAAIIAPLRALGVDWTVAAFIAAALWPLVLFALLLVALRWLAEDFVPREWTRACAFVALFATGLIFHFSPGRVDHHGLAALTVVVAAGGVLRFMRDPVRLRAAALAGGALAFGLCVGLEVLPWLLLLAGWMGLWVLVKGRAASLGGAVFGLSLYFASALLLAASVAPGSYYDLNPLAFSWLYVLLAGGVALALIVAALLAGLPRMGARLALGGAAAAALGVAFLWRFPFLWTGPYGGVDPELAALLFSHIVEALPLIERVPERIELLGTILMPLGGLVVAVGFLARGDRSRRPVWALWFVLLLAALGLALFYQARVLPYAQLFAIMPLTALLPRGLAWARLRWRGRKLAAAELGVILLVGPLLSVLIPAAIDGRSFNKGVLLFPVNPGPARVCESPMVWQMLDLPSLYGDRPRVVLSTINEGAEILFRTAHFALAAPYHTNVKGNLAAARFLTATDPGEAEAIARAQGVELVLLCKDLPDLYRAKGSGAAFNQDGSAATDPNATLAQQIADGKPPAWLKPVEMPLMGKMMLLEVLPRVEDAP